MPTEVPPLFATARKSRWLMLAAWLLAIATSIFVISNWVGVRRSTAVSLPVDLSEGSASRSKEFAADFREPYEIQLEIDRIRPDADLQCLLIGGCREDSPVSLRWRIRSRGLVIGEGSSDQQEYPSYTDDTLGRGLGAARLEPGHRYVLEVISLNDASALAYANPRVEASVHPSAFKDEFVLRSLGSLLALAIAAMGVAFAVIGFFRTKLARKSLTD